MSNLPKYDRLSPTVRENYECEYRRYANLIPAWRRRELDAMVREEAEKKLAETNLEFTQHWDAPADYDQISSWADYVDPSNWGIKEIK